MGHKYEAAREESLGTFKEIEAEMLRARTEQAVTKREVEKIKVEVAEVSDRIGRNRSELDY